MDFVAALVSWLVQEAGAAGRRRFSDPVARALARVVDDAVPRAVARVHADPALREHTIALLRECPPGGLPLVDGTPLARLATATGQWVANIESPVGEQGPPPPLPDHPLARALHREILAGIRHEALRGEGVLHPLWSDYRRAVDTERILSRIDAPARVPSDVSPPTRIEYWHPPVTHAARFVGRAGELARLSTSDDEVRVRLVHGIGGVGKTALALAFADRVARDYPDGRVFVDFQSYSEHPRHVRKTAEQALAELLPRCGIDDRAVAGMDLHQRELAWKRAISGRRMLFLWDNVGELDQIEPLLTGQPDCLTLITSRADLRLPSASLLLEHLREDDALELFSAVAGADAVDRGLLAQAVRLCGWMPLQILVHAASVRRRRTLAELVTELAKLPTGDRLARLFGSLDLSYRELSEGAQQAWRVLGVHPGPHLTAGTTAAMLDCTVEEAVRHLDELIDANFAGRHRGRFDHFGGGLPIPAEPRFYAYVTHDLLRDYARHQAAQRPEAAVANISRLLDHYWDQLEAEVDHAWLQVERVCLVRALWIAAPNESVRDLAWLVGDRLHDSGWVAEAEMADWYALHLYQEIGDEAGEAHTLWRLGGAAVTRGDHDEALRHWHAALDILRRTADRSGEALVLMSVAVSLTFRGDKRAAIAALERVLELSRELGDRGREFQARLQLATTRLSLGPMERADVDRALKDARALVRLSPQSTDPVDRGRALLFLAQIKESQGAVKAADAAYREALQIFSAAGRRHAQANARFGIGSIALRRGHHVKALEEWRAALTIYREIGDVEGEAKTLSQMAEAAIGSSALEEAEPLLREAYRIYGESGSLLGRAAAARRLAEVVSRGGRSAEACALLQESLRILEGIESPHAQWVRAQLVAYGCP